jgi:hypothetical protein
MVCCWCLAVPLGRLNTCACRMAGFPQRMPLLPCSVWLMVSNIWQRCRPHGSDGFIRMACTYSQQCQVVASHSRHRRGLLKEALTNRRQCWLGSAWYATISHQFTLDVKNIHWFAFLEFSPIPHKVNYLHEPLIILLLALLSRALFGFK